MSGRLLWVGALSIAPAALALAMLFFQLKRVEIATRDTEAELVLAKQKRARNQAANLEVEADPS